jgi:hypothetical protein
MDTERRARSPDVEHRERVRDLFDDYPPLTPWRITYSTLRRIVEWRNANGARGKRGSDMSDDTFDAEAVRKAFEESFLTYFGRGPGDAVFDQLGEHWLERTDEGRYEFVRVDDAWTGWLAASRRYAHIEHMFRVAHLGHEQMFAEVQRLNAQRCMSEWRDIETAPKDVWLILTNGEVVAAGCWADTTFQEFRDADGRYQDQVDAWSGWTDVLGGMQPDPTAWMPLPPPPTRAEAL